MRVTSYRYERSRGWTPQLPQPDPEVDLVLVFGAPSYRDDIEPFTELVEAFSQAEMAGCSTAGEILGQMVYDESLCVAAIRFDDTQVLGVQAPIEVTTSHATGLSLAAELIRSPGLAWILVLSDGLRVNGSNLTRGINDDVPAPTTVTGGLAADGDRFQSTWVLVDGKPASGHVSAVGFYGDVIRVGHGSKGGWEIFGPDRTITRSTDNILFELDGKPALALYKEYLGELSVDLPASGMFFPLEITDPKGERSVVRTILGVDEDTQSLVFAGDLPEGYLARLMQSNFARLIDGAEAAAEEALMRGGEGAQLCIAISCVGRRLVLGGRAEDELEATSSVLPAGVTQVGFYSYGEISPYAGGTSDLHNQTMTLTTIAEE